MVDQEKKENKAVRMQRLRRAVDRLRNMRSREEPETRKRSWLAWLKSRLGWGGHKKDSEGEG